MENGKLPDICLIRLNQKDNKESDMATIGFIGSGNLGGTLARLAIGAGHKVLMSNSRGPETLNGLIEELGSSARAVTVREASALSELVVVTIPLKNYIKVPFEELKGKTVIDTMNYYPWRDGQIGDLDNESTTTSELLQAHLPFSYVVKAFNTIFYRHLAELPRPKNLDDRSALPIAGNDNKAKSKVKTLLDEIGFDLVDLGQLTEGWRIQRDTAAYVSPYAAFPKGPEGEDFSSAMERLSQGARPADAAKIAMLAGEAKRYRDQ